MRVPNAKRLVLGYNLTPAQQVFLMALPSDGSWKATHETIQRINAEFGTNSLRGFGQTDLVEGYYREQTRHRLTEVGQAVLAKLTQSERAGA